MTGDVTVTLSPGEVVALDPTATVVVPTRGGDRFHRSGTLFATACRVDVATTVETTVCAAIDSGFTPCQHPECFGESDG